MAGIIRKYRVIYTEYSVYNDSVTVGSGFVEVKVTHHMVRRAVDSSPLLSVVLTNLAPYRNYSVVIEGATKFYGKPSPAIFARTDQDG